MITNITCKADITAILTRGNYGWEYLNQRSHIVYLKKNGTGKDIVHRIKMPAVSGSGSIITETSNNIALTPGSYELVADLDDGLGNLLSGDYYYYTTSLSATITYPKAKSTYPSFSTGCGLRIKKISHFGDKLDSECLYSMNYEYNDPRTNNSSGILYDILNYVNVTRRLFGVGVPRPGSPSSTTTTQLYGNNAVDIYSNNGASNPYGNSSGVGYTYVKERREGETNTGHTISKFKNEIGYFK